MARRLRIRKEVHNCGYDDFITFKNGGTTRYVPLAKRNPAVTSKWSYMAGDTLYNSNFVIKNRNNGYEYTPVKAVQKFTLVCYGGRIKEGRFRFSSASSGGTDKVNLTRCISSGSYDIDVSFDNKTFENDTLSEGVDLSPTRHMFLTWVGQDAGSKKADFHGWLSRSGGFTHFDTEWISSTGMDASFFGGYPIGGAQNHWHIWDRWVWVVKWIIGHYVWDYRIDGNLMGKGGGCGWTRGYSSCNFWVSNPEKLVPGIILKNIDYTGDDNFECILDGSQNVTAYYSY